MRQINIKRGYNRLVHNGVTKSQKEAGGPFPTVLALASGPEFDENEEEIFPEYAIENNMGYSIMPELVTDVVINALNQKRDASEEELLKALNYYLDADAFIKL